MARFVSSLTGLRGVLTVTVAILIFMVIRIGWAASSGIIDATQTSELSRYVQGKESAISGTSPPRRFSAPRNLAPEECTVLIYTDLKSKPSTVRDTSGTCPAMGGQRAFVLDMRLNGIGHPNLNEASPMKAQNFNCLSGVACQVVVRGYGLKAGDTIYYVEGADTECPPGSSAASVSSSRQSRVSSSRQIRVSSAATFDAGAQPLAKETNLVVYDLGVLPPGEYSLCYSSSLALQNAPPKDTDYIYKAGTLSVGRNLFSCDFDEDMCGIITYTDHDLTDLKWTRNTGETETPGTGPSFDHTQGPQGNGSYIYMDSPGFVAGAVATVMTPPALHPEGPYCFRYRYHMFGDHVNSLRLYVHHLKDNKNVTGDWGTPKSVRVGNHGNEWKEGGFEFYNDGETPSQVVIEALAGYSETGDIALDDLKITTGKCSEEIMRGTYNDRFICGEVRLLSGNWSEDKTWYLESAVSCAGRGYSYDQLKGGWVPCCVPTYGEYTVVLQDRFGDGWSGSKIEFRFFDKVMTFGEDFTNDEGSEKKYNMVVGQLHISRAEADESSIALEVSVMQPHAHVWCGAALADSPPPSVELLKKYGIRSREKTNAKGEKVRMSISNGEDNARMLEANTEYDIYCYAESASEMLAPEIGGTEAQPMDDDQVEASRIRVTTDSTPPDFEISLIDIKMHELTAQFTVDEAATVWCLAAEDSEDGNRPTITMIRDQGMKKYVPSAETKVSQSLTLEGLMPDTTYSVYCYAEDIAMPEPNGLTTQEVHASVREVISEGKTPTLSIERYKAFARGFAIFVKVDVPGKVWCGAAMAGSPYPSRDDVRRVGATAEVTDTSKVVELEIRGVPQNTRYTVYCFASSRNENREMSDSEMWDTALELASFGKFCEFPVAPKAYADGEATPFDPITPTEEFLIREYMKSRRELRLDGVYRITQLPPKSEVIEYLDNGGPFPKRYARVRVGTCRYGEGSYQQYRVGPLDSGNQRDLMYEALGEPVSTECGGYTPQGVFGRRLLDLHHEDELSEMLEESFGYAFGETKCKDMSERKCLDFGPLVYERRDNETSKGTEFPHSHTWVGLKTPDGDHVPFYFVFTAPTVDMSDPRDGSMKQKLFNHHFMEVDAFWYDGNIFYSLEELLEAYAAGNLRRVTPEVMAIRKLKAEQQREADLRQMRLEEDTSAASAKTRRLAPGPNPLGRDGLEYRLAPEHVEPEGKRFTIRASPGAESYTIEYAGWKFVVNNDRDTSLRLWDISFNGIRIAYEAGLMEAMAHYSVAERNWYFLDSWYGGLGAAARKLHPGVECPSTGVTVFWDESLCVFEQDRARPIRSHWKSGELRDGAPHLSLVIRQMLTVSNYDYLTDYIFELSGVFQGTVSFTGELYAGVEVPWFSSRQHHFGTQVTGSMRMGALHNHFAVWKIDFDIAGDAADNSILFKEVIPDPIRPGAHKLNSWLAEREQDGYLKFNSTRPMHYYVVNEDHLVYGNIGGYLVKPLQTIAIPQPDFEVYAGPAAWTKYRILTAVRKEHELDCTLPRDNKYASRPAVDLDRHIEDNESILRQDLVTWISDGIWHLPVIEDMPLTVCIGNTLGWMSKPANFFTEDPSMDLHNAIAGDVRDPGTCAIIRNERKMTFY